MDACVYVVTDKLSGSYITTAALRRSGCHPEPTAGKKHDAIPTAKHKVRELEEHEQLHRWITGKEEPHSNLLGECSVTIDSTKVTHAFKHTATISGQQYTVIPSNEMRMIMGYELVATADGQMEEDESPLQANTPTTLRKEMQQALNIMEQQVVDNHEISAETKSEVINMLQYKYDRIWRAKYDLQQPAALPPMEIKLKPGAEPARIKRRYRWTNDQKEFLQKLIRKLVDTGVISKVDSEWCCPVVLVIKPESQISIMWSSFIAFR